MADRPNQTAFTPEMVDLMREVYKRLRGKLSTVTDLDQEELARRVIHATSNGETSAQRIADAVIVQLKKDKAEKPSKPA
jgi:hypothetical protein